MKGIRYHLLYVACAVWAAAACTDDAPATTAGQAPEGMVEVRVALPGTLTASPLAGREGAATKGRAAARATDWTPDNTLLADKATLPLPAGSTLWLLADGTTTEGEYKKLKAYVVRGAGAYQSLYPCTVYPDGSLNKAEAAPLYLPAGTYRFSAVSPARAFYTDDGKWSVEPDEFPGYFRQTVSNGDYLIANDARYTQTGVVEQPIIESNEKVQFIKLNPLINQTAQLKFTISLDPTDPYLHSCDISPAGVEISGLQTAYGRDETMLWNWSSETVADTLIAYPGYKNERLTLFDDDEGIRKTDNGLVIETAVLPTDCTSSSIIVLFNLLVNGIPTQYEMMLNRKVLRAGFSYHYKGVLSIEDGITNIAWQNVSWDTEVELE